MFSILSVVLMFAGATVAQANSSREDLLQFLALAVQQTRAEPRPEAAPAPGPTPDLAPLVGMSADRLRRAIGEPDGCSVLEAERCAGRGDWNYLLDPAPAGVRGGGGRELTLEFDSAGKCAVAKWRFSR